MAVTLASVSEFAMGPVTFADVDADGNIDILYTLYSKDKSLISSDFIVIHYNVQARLCGLDVIPNTSPCRSSSQLCTADDNFIFQGFPENRKSSRFC